MRTPFRTRLAGLGSGAVLSIAAIMLLIAALACGGSVKPPPADYVGNWTGDDQSTLSIKADGSADYKSGNTSVSGGTAAVDESAKTLKISFMRIGPSFTIDKPPTDGQMTLSGVVYKKASLADPGKTPVAKDDNSNSSRTAADIPDEAAVDKLVHRSIRDLADAVDSGDFTSLYENASTDFQSTYTIEQVQKQFGSYVEKKSTVLPILKQAEGLDADFKPAVSTRSEKGLTILVANGTFDTSPQTLRFETEYVYRGGEWKMLALVLNIK